MENITLKVLTRAGGSWGRHLIRSWLLLMVDFVKAHFSFLLSALLFPTSWALLNSLRPLPTTFSIPCFSSIDAILQFKLQIHVLTIVYCELFSYLVTST
jgi:hypothetical protein